MSENDVILVKIKISLKIKTITQGNLLRRESTHNLPPKAEAKVKAKDKFKAFYFKVVPWVSP